MNISVLYYTNYVLVKGGYHMDKIRAQEIVNSNIEIEVFYNGDSVWIKSLDSNTADVENIKTHKSMKVPLTDLKEDMTIS